VPAATIFPYDFIPDEYATTKEKTKNVFTPQAEVQILYN